MIFTLLAAIIQCEAHYNYESMLAVANRDHEPCGKQSFPEQYFRCCLCKRTVCTGMDRQPEACTLPGSWHSFRIGCPGCHQWFKTGSRIGLLLFLYAPSTSRSGVVIGDNVFFTSWMNKRTGISPDSQSLDLRSDFQERFKSRFFLEG